MLFISDVGEKCCCTNIKALNINEYYFFAHTEYFFYKNEECHLTAIFRYF